MDLIHPSPENARAYRSVLGRYATGVAVVTAMTPAGPVGLTINSFASLSLDPPLVLWSPAKDSARHGAFVGAQHYTIHILSADQQALALEFARPDIAFADVAHGHSPEGAPVLDGVRGRLDCETYTLHDAGDHTLIIGRVLRAGTGSGDPLIFCDGAFGVPETP